MRVEVVPSEEEDGPAGREKTGQHCPPKGPLDILTEYPQIYQSCIIFLPCENGTLITRSTRERKYSKQTSAVITIIVMIAVMRQERN